MGIFTTLKRGLSSAGGGSSATAQTCIVDANRLMGGKQGRDRISARDQIQTLQRLSRYAKKESVSVVAVVEGKELRAVEHGGDYQGVTVYFTELAGDLNKAIKQALRKHAGALAVIENAELEASLRASGAQTMRISTFKKGLDSVLGSGGSGGGASSRGGGGGNQRRRNAGNRRRRGPRDDAQQDAPQEKTDAEPKDPVSELIDLVE